MAFCEAQAVEVYILQSIFSPASRRTMLELNGNVVAATVG